MSNNKAISNSHILIVEDMDEKYQDLLLIVQRLLPGCHVTRVKEFHAGLPQLDFESENLDIGIVDMSFGVNKSPSEEAGFESLAGLELLQYAARIRVDIKFVVYTAHNEFRDADSGDYFESLEALREHLEMYFGDICLGCIYSKDPLKKIEKQFREAFKRAHLI